MSLARRFQPPFGGNDPLVQFIQNAGLDRVNYSALLQRWSDQRESLPDDLAPGTVLSTYACTARDARANLVAKGWTFSDGGLYLDAPTITSITPGSSSLDVAFTLPGCSADLDNFEYSLNNGDTWTAFSPEQTSSPLTVPGVTAGVTYQIGIRGKTNVAGAPSTIVSFRNPDFFVSGGDRITWFETLEERFEMDDLASRTQQRPYTSIQAAGPNLFRVWGVDSNTLEDYSYLTDMDYRDSRNSYGQRNEGFEGGYGDSTVTGNDLNGFSVTSATSSGRQIVTLNAPYGFSCPRLNASNTAGYPDSDSRFCSVFGPEMWSNPFTATAGEALSFEYQASSSDNYEPYAFLVKVSDLGDGTYSYGGARSGDPNSENPLETHDIILYARGENTSSQGSDWLPASGAVGESGTYRFRFVNGSYDGTGGTVLGAAFKVDVASIEVSDAQTVTFANPGDKIGTSTTFTTSATSSSGLPLDWTSTNTTVCNFSSNGSPVNSLSNVVSGGLVTVNQKDEGTCTLAVTAPGGTLGGRTFATANPATQTFQILSEPERPTAIRNPTISGTAETGSILSAGEGEWRDGGAPISATTYQWRTTKSGVTTNIVGATSSAYCVANDPAIIGSTISVAVTKTNSVNPTSATSSETAVVSSAGSCDPPPPPPSPPVIAGGGGGGPTLTPQPVVTPPAVTPRVIPRLPATPATQQGPVLRGNVPPAPPSAPTATIGGRSTPIQTQMTSPTGFSLTAGVLNLGLQVQGDQGVVRQNNTGGTEVEVKTGSTTALTGSGLLPRSTVQVFLPLQGTNSKEVARIPVDETGAFSGDAVFATRANERPMPIGRQVMQIVSLDEDGQQSVVEMTINIAQGAPAPELDRTVGEVPTLTPGQSIATNAGEPEVVRVTADSTIKSATVEGDGWTMSVNIGGARGEVSESSPTTWSPERSMPLT